jgi:hypothetical protein
MLPEGLCVLVVDFEDTLPLVRAEIILKYYIIALPRSPASVGEEEKHTGSRVCRSSSPYRWECFSALIWQSFDSQRKHSRSMSQVIGKMSAD